MSLLEDLNRQLKVEVDDAVQRLTEHKPGNLLRINEAAKKVMACFGGQLTRKLQAYPPHRQHMDLVGGVAVTSSIYGVYEIRVAPWVCSYLNAAEAALEEEHTPQRGSK